MRPNTTTEGVKTEIEEKLGIPPSKQRLIFYSARLKSAIKLEEEHSLEYYGISNGDKLHLVLSLSG